MKLWEIILGYNRYRMHVRTFVRIKVRPGDKAFNAQKQPTWKKGFAAGSGPLGTFG